MILDQTQPKLPTPMTRLGTSERLGKTERYTVKIVIRMVIERMKRIPSLKLTAKLPETKGLEDDPFGLLTGANC